MRFADVLNKEDGTYLVTSEEVLNYADRWAYGYLVVVRKLLLEDIRPGVLYGVWTTALGRSYEIVKHIDSLSDATAAAKEYGQQAIYDLREKKVVYV